MSRLTGLLFVWVQCMNQSCGKHAVQWMNVMVLKILHDDLPLKDELTCHAVTYSVMQENFIIIIVIKELGFFYTYISN